ncbi:MAG: hypothetical protein J0H01_16300 [Rhizobiales bacterium]|nr:hypothetical protein [Hyphomicrobiales bacterium]
MRYLGGISGSGVVTCGGKGDVRASYDFDGFFREPGGVMGCGEIRLDSAVLKDVFGRNDVQLLTDDGRLLDLTFSEKELRAASEVAHVDVTGQLPSAAQYWRH